MLHNAKKNLPSIALWFVVFPTILLHASVSQIPHSFQNEFEITDSLAFEVLAKFPPVFRGDLDSWRWSVEHTWIKNRKKLKSLTFRKFSNFNETHKHWWKIFGILHDRFRCTFDFFSFSMCNTTPHKNSSFGSEVTNKLLNEEKKTWVKQSNRARVGFFSFRVKMEMWMKEISYNSMDVGGARSPKPGRELI